MTHFINEKQSFKAPQTVQGKKEEKGTFDRVKCFTLWKCCTVTLIQNLKQKNTENEFFQK